MYFYIDFVIVFVKECILIPYSYSSSFKLNKFYTINNY